MRHLTIGVVTMLLGIAVRASAAEPLSADDMLWRQKIGYNPQVHGTVPQSADADVLGRVPYTYYPTTNQVEVVFDLAAARKLLPANAPPPGGPVQTLQVKVLLQKGDTVVGSGTIPLDDKGRGAGTIKLPRLAAGVYRVEYEFGGATLPAARTFRRSYFDFEGCAYGTEHKVYAPFTPVEVQGNKVSVVDRTYTVNAQGLFDSVVSKGRELLAEPMKLVVETVAGQRVEWQGGGWFGSGVKGRTVYPDQARFETAARGAGFSVQSSVEVEEDGCAKVRMTLKTESRKPQPIARAWLEIALKESEAPLCHLVGMNSMRHNYAGTVPRGGQITWLNQPWRPARFAVEPFVGQPPASYQVWEAGQQMNWGSQRWNFAPYVWLGAEERGLAWFGDDLRGYATDGKSSIQRLFIAPGKVVLRVELIQLPVTLDAPRTFVFGLQASPTKPLPEDWRGYDVPGGGGMPVVVWGGFNCSSKYPVNHEWSIVDKIVAGRGSGKVDEAFFTGIVAKYHLENAKANDQPWLASVLQFAGKEAGNPHPNGTTVYFEEHQTNGDHPEMVEYMDEWADTTWSRFRYYEYSGFQEGSLPKGTWGPEVRSANAPSYRDFAVYTASQWMQRGVGIYYDNTFPTTDYNRSHFRDQGIAWSSSIWGHREYYKRVWKRSRELMEKGLTPLDPLYSKTDPTRRLRLHIVGHVTNCQVLPYTTWWDATLGVEQPGQWLPDGTASAEWRAQALAKSEWPFIILPTPSKDAHGQALPYPPDYLRAMEMGRMAGLIPHYRHMLRSEDALGGLGIGFGATDQGKDAAVREHRIFSDAAMGLVHEIRGGASGYDHPQVGALRRALSQFGYGKPGVKVFNYWEEKPFVAVDNAAVKWIAMTHAAAPFGMLLLQSYRPDATSTTVRFPEGKLLVDAETRDVFEAAADGTVTVGLSADYGTRLLYVLRRADEPTLLPKTPGSVLVDDYELGLGFAFGIRGSGIEVVADSQNPANHVLRITPGHPAQNFLRSQGLALPGDCDLSFNFRIPQVPAGGGSSGLLQLGYRDAQGRRYAFGLGLSRAKDGTVRWTVAKPLLALDGGKNEGYQTELAAGIPTAVVDTRWHSLAIRTRDKHHEILLDGEKVFEGEDDRNPGGGFSIAPGWGWDLPIPYIEIDDLKVDKG